MRREPPGRRWFARALVAGAAGVGTAVVVGIALALADIYVTGHGGRTINGPLWNWPALGIHLSPSDVVLLGSAAVASGIAWRRVSSEPVR
jgi:hypothetical protein